ncbi:MAG: hypothetical protein IT336_16460 [Thermomicrobiales bacterium]|nr:hypothetical protein [Thermomicrobiales bacterium]
MANRISIPTLHRPTISFDPGRFKAAWRALANWRIPRGEDLRLLLFRVIWAPFWIGSDIPTPRFRVRDEPLPPGGLVGDYVAGELNRLTLRIWLQHALNVVTRAIWLPLLAGCAWLAIELAGGPELRVWALVGIGLLLVPLALLFIAMIRPSRRRVARMLDRSFALQERMVTAVANIGRDVPADGERPSVTYLQMADAANVINELKTHPAFRIRPPVREIVLAMVCILTLSALFFLRGMGGGIPALASDPVPRFVPAAERLAREPDPIPQTGTVQVDARTPEEVQEMAERSSQAQQDLKKLGDALSDQAVTRAAAEAIQRGDYAEAADLIRQVAENADQLSPAAREGLADDLDRAADEMSSGQTGLADATRDAASGLREGGDAAKEGMSALGDAVDRSASDIVSQQELANEMSRAEAAQASGSSGQESQSGDQGEPGDGPPEQEGNSSSSEPQDESGAAGQSSGASLPADDDSAGNEAEGPGEDGAGGGEQPGGSSGAQGEQGGSQPGPGGQSPSESGNAPGQGAQPGEAEDAGASSTRSGPDTEGGAPGAGAGSGSSPNQESPDSGRGSTGGEAGNGAVSDPDVSDSDGALGDDAAAEEDPRSAITLSRSPDAAGVPTGGQGNSASVGSGSGAAVSTGTTVQGEVGAAGPDSNHVPSEYRGLVEDYFSDQDGS